MIDLKKISKHLDAFKMSVLGETEELQPGELVAAIADMRILRTLLAVSELIPGMTASIATTAMLAALKLPVDRAKALTAISEREITLGDELVAFFCGDEDEDEEADEEPEAETT